MLMQVISLDRLQLIPLGFDYMFKITRYSSIASAGVRPRCHWLGRLLGYSTVNDMDCDADCAYDRVFTTIKACVDLIVCLRSPKG
ncbi:hypothetical protein DPMN_096506 [Dreissena polymorpha]|uniref:Uncharacterized protein n=1 Tax=Dreissena polymorpha TaxID=45954 RepID=A0A9D4L9W1_DREPO|nr:hypothetical protein DPMN_096506 [Dreissena polymorpha]